VRLVALVLCSLALVVTGCGGHDGGDGSAGDTTTAATGAASGESAPGCTRVDAPPAKDEGGQTAPTEPLAAGKTYALDFRTNCGSFTVTLDTKAAPKTAASLVALARDGFYDGTIFHRIVPGFVIQGGDPTQTGSGGPGYSTVDVPPAGTTYTYGTVAMAKTAAEPAGTSGSQFFVVTAPDAQLPPEYAVVGKVTKGLETVDRIGALGDQAEQPRQTVLVEQVTVTER
jgi:peptidyl-prolyl cis-trans isomerase B (cyclophilin B)